jgi:hypothetical protein
MRHVDVRSTVRYDDAFSALIAEAQSQNGVGSFRQGSRPVVSEPITAWDQLIL